MRSSLPVFAHTDSQKNLSLKLNQAMTALSRYTNLTPLQDKITMAKHDDIPGARGGTRNAKWHMSSVQYKMFNDWIKAGGAYWTKSGSNIFYADGDVSVTGGDFYVTTGKMSVNSSTFYNVTALSDTVFQVNGDAPVVMFRDSGASADLRLTSLEYNDRTFTYGDIDDAGGNYVSWLSLSSDNGLNYSGTGDMTTISPLLIGTTTKYNVTAFGSTKFQISGNNPVLMLRDTGASADNRNTFIDYEDKTLTIGDVFDDGSNANVWLTMSEAGGVDLFSSSPFTRNGTNIETPWVRSGSNIYFSGGNVGINVTPSYIFHSRSSSTNYNAHVHQHYSSANYYAYMGFQRSKSNTLGSNAATVNNDYLGGVYFYGNSGSGFTNGGYIHAIQDGVASTFTPTKLLLGTSNGSSTWVERLIIDSDGNIGIGSLTPSSILDVSRSSNTVEIMSVTNSNTGGSAESRIQANAYNNNLLLRCFGSNHSSASNQNWFQSTLSNNYFVFIPSATGKAMYMMSGGTIGVYHTAPPSVRTAEEHSIFFAKAGWLYGSDSANNAGLANNMYLHPTTGWTIQNSGDYGSLVYQYQGYIDMYHSNVTSGAVTLYRSARVLRGGGIRMYNFSTLEAAASGSADFYCFSGEMWVQDQSGNQTQLSPHDENGEWEYDSRNTKTGKHIKIKMEKLIKYLEEYHGKKFIEVIS